jgi:DNA-directed RNA polymerase specialized sigma24 family protein
MVVEPGGEAEPAEQALGRLLVRERAALLRFVERRAGGALLRVETAEDLVQGISAHALARCDRLELQGERALQGWVLELAANFLDDRREHWSALKRNGAGALRLALTESTEPGLAALRELPASATGPSTFAARREQLTLATQAMALLLPRDRELIDAMCRGLTAREHGDQLGLGAAAAERARSRALERFRRSYELVLRSRGAR